MYGTDADAHELESRLAGGEVDADFNHRFSDTLQARFLGGILTEAGSSRSLYNTEYQPRQAVQLWEASTTWLPLSNPTLDGELKAGALDQNDWNTPLLFKDVTFPAVRERLALKRGAWKFEWTSEQSYAADTQNSQPTARWFQGSAVFFLDRLATTFDPSSDLSTEIHVSHYLFRDLSAQAAYQGRFVGNTVSGLGQSNSQFAYGFQGFEIGTHIGYRLTPSLRPEVMISALQNVQAPSGSNLGARATLGTQIQFNPHLKITPVAELYFIESDAAPALFNDPALAHTNGRGYGLGFDVPLSPGRGAESPLDLTFRYYDTTVLTANPYRTGNLQWAQLMLKVNYDVL